MTLHVEPLKSLSDLPAVELRRLDVLECLAGGITDAQAIEISINSATESFAVYRDGALFALWGFRDPSIVGCGPARMWLLTTPEVDKYKIAFVREGKRLLAEMLALFGSVDCIVWAGHSGARRFLSALGFTGHTVQQFYGMPEFVRMIKEAA